MATDKALYSTPPRSEMSGFTGEEVSLGMDTSPVEGDFAVTELEDGGAEIDFDPSQGLGASQIPFAANLAEHMDENSLSGVARKLIGFYDKDEMARKDWKDTYEDGLDLLGIKIEQRTEPWTGACGITHPLLAEAVVRFQSQQIGEMFPASGPVRVKIAGKESPEKVRQSTRVKDFLNYLLTEEMPEYRGEVDKLLFTLPLAGSAFKKTYYDPSLARPVSEYVPAEDLVVGAGTKSMATCRRLTHINNIDPNDIRKLQIAGFYRDTEITTAPPDIGDVEKKKEEIVGVSGRYDDGEMVTLLEMHCDLDLEGFEDFSDGSGSLPEGVPTGIALPYVVTIDKNRMRVLAIRRNWLEDDASRARRQHFTHYEYIPGMGFYGLGLIHLIGGIAKGSTSILRQLVDAGTLSNLPGGFKTRGLRVKGDQTPIAAGEWRDVDIPGGKISDNLFPLPYGEPSQVLAALLGSIVEEGRRFASLTDVNISSMNNEAPVGTTLALLERNLKVMTAISSRIHSSLRGELKILASIIRDWYQEYPYEMEDSEADLVTDFDGRVDVIPVSDPNSSTMAQRIMTMQTALQLAERAPPGMYKGMDVLHRRMLQALEIQDIDEIIPSEDDIKLIDPVSENQNILNMKPVKAFITQDHQSHIAVHMMGMQDPKTQQMLEQSPTAQISYAAGMAHITEHLGYQYRQEIEQSLGVQLPPEGEALPPEIEVELSQLIAQAANDLFNRHVVEQQQQEVKELLEDPIVQDQKRNTDIKEAESKARIKNQEDKVQLELAKILQKQELESEKIDNAKHMNIAGMIQDHSLQQERLDQEREIEGERIRANMLGDIIEAASRTEELDTRKKMQVIDFILQSAKEESKGIRDQLNERVKSSDANVKMLVDIVNKWADEDDEKSNVVAIVEPMEEGPGDIE